MKKLVSLFLALCLISLLFPALAEDDISGDWFGSMYGAAFTLTLHEDGTYTLASGDNLGTEGTWELKDNLLIMDGDEDKDNCFVYDGSSLVNEFHGVAFTREAVDIEKIIIAEPEPNASAEDYNGDWICLYIEVNGIVMDLASNIDALEMEEVPAMTIEEDGTVTITGLEDYAGSITADPLTFEFNDGILHCGSREYEQRTELLDISIIMLRDGMVTLDFGYGERGPIFHFIPAEEYEAPDIISSLQIVNFSDLATEEELAMGSYRQLSTLPLQIWVPNELITEAEIPQKEGYEDTLLIFIYNGNPDQKLVIDRFIPETDFNAFITAINNGEMEETISDMEAALVNGFPVAAFYEIDEEGNYYCTYLYFIEDYVIKFSFQEYDEIDLLNFSTMISLSLEPMT
ncbi:MAG: hypothetical protein IKG87_10100 [Clostridia bacterium]|nr:hypothetical protein [Clostridia bacterium]